MGTIRINIVPMIVCLCHRVTEHDIAHEARYGCGSFAELQERTRVATGCGACLEFAQEAYAAHADGGRDCGSSCSGNCGSAAPCGQDVRAIGVGASAAASATPQRIAAAA